MRNDLQAVDIQELFRVNEDSEIRNGIPHIWLLDFRELDDYSDKLVKVLSEDELIRAKKFYFDDDRRAYITTRGCLRYLLASFTAMDPAKIVFKYTDHGKPIIEQEGADLQFNVSHSRNLGLIGFHVGSPIGVDIESVKHSGDLEQVARRFFSANEVSSLLSLPEKEQITGFYNCWTRKESFIKALGHGLSFPLDQFEVSLAPGERAAVLNTYFDPPEKLKWSLEALDVPQGYAAAFAVPEIIQSYKFNIFDIS